MSRGKRKEIKPIDESRYYYDIDLGRMPKEDYLNEILKPYINKDNMHPDTHVYCTKCVNFQVTYLNDINGDPFCRNENHCDFWNFDDSKPFSERPYYRERSELND